MTVLPCQGDPDRWFDRTDLTLALAGCLACPARSRCAREALGVKASWGMWAGIWIDRNLAHVAHYLQAIAGAAPPTFPPRTPETRRIEARRRTPVSRTAAEPNVAAVITARSSGHCEILAPDCRLGLETIASRIPGRSWRELPDAAAGYAVCQRCLAAIMRMELRLSQQFGYIVDAPANAANVPFYWRQNRWMRFDSAGRATAWARAERTA
jgi:hypothetical protein